MKTKKVNDGFESMTLEDWAKFGYVAAFGLICLLLLLS